MSQVLIDISQMQFDIVNQGILRSLPGC